MQLFPKPPWHGLPVFSIAAAVALVWLANACVAADTQEPRVLFKNRFNGPDSMRGWSGTGVVQRTGDGTEALVIENTTNSPGRTISRSFNIEDLRGRIVRASARLKASGVSSKPNSWNGIKFMLVLEGTSGKSYPQAPVGFGTFDWRQIGFRTRIPDDVTNIVLVLGLEQVAGKVWFSEVSLVAASERTGEALAGKSGSPFKGHSLSRLRGAMVSPSIDPESLRVLGHDWNANVIRFQLTRLGKPGSAVAVEQYDEWLEGELKKLDSLLPLCQRLGVYVVVDLHSPPGGTVISGGYVAADGGFFSDKTCQTKFVEVWQKIAARYRDRPAIWGYDLVNEPVESEIGTGCVDWQELAEKAAAAIREIDKGRTIIVEPALWGGPEGLDTFEPLHTSNVVYSVHMYLPHAFTHQGVYSAGTEYRYPGNISGVYWDKAKLEQALRPVVNFQKRYGVQIYIGEFSAIRWAPDNSAERYLGDLIAIFEDRGWDWSYHAFREWSGWSVEHSSNRNETERSPTPTARQKILQSWLKKNEKPEWGDPNR